jgi:kynurenine formamidase
MSGASQSRPRYDDLPLNEVLGARSAWNYFGPDDSLGTLNHLTPARLAAACALVRAGQSFGLNLPVMFPDPGIFWRSPPVHAIAKIDRNTYDDSLDGFFLQGSTHWDGFLHVRAREEGFYGGREGEPMTSDLGLGIDQWARTGITGRGVLLDIGEFLRAEGTPGRLDTDFEITAEQLARVAAHQNVKISEGTILCLRFGWTEYALSLPAPARRTLLEAGRFPGLRADEAMARFIWDHGIAAIAADTPAVEVAPGDARVGSLHRRSLVLMGTPFGELFSFGELAAACHEDGRWDFLFISMPMNLPGGVGSPANATAIR